MLGEEGRHFYSCTMYCVSFGTGVQTDENPVRPKLVLSLVCRNQFSRASRADEFKRKQSF